LFLLLQLSAAAAEVPFVNALATARPPPPPPPNVTAASALLWPSSPSTPSPPPFQDAAWLCHRDLFACWQAYGPAKSGALRAALQAEAVRGVEWAAERRARQLEGLLDWTAAKAASSWDGGLGGVVRNATAIPHPKRQKRRRRAKAALNALLNGNTTNASPADAAFDAAVGTLAALAAGDAVLAFGEANVAAALRVASLLLPVRVALNPRAVVGQTLQLAIDAARTGFRPVMLFPFLVDGRVNNFQELAGFAAQTAVDRVTSGINAVIAGFDRGARRWWRARSRHGNNQRGETSAAALAALSAGPFVGGGGGGFGGAGLRSGQTAAANGSSSSSNVDAGLAAVLPPALSSLLLRAAAAAAAAAARLAAPSPSSSPSEEAPDLIPATTTTTPFPHRPLAEELRATLAVAGDVFVEWARASAGDLERAAATLDAFVPGPNPARAVRLARDALSRRAEASRRVLERAFPAQDVLETSDILRVAADEILAAVEQAAATAVRPDAPGIVAAREALSALSSGMRFVAAPVGLAADAAFRAPPPLANATLAAVRALAQEGADEVEAAVARMRADYGLGNGTVAAVGAERLRRTADAALASARRVADRAMAGAADAASSMVLSSASLLQAAVEGEGGGEDGGGGGGRRNSDARAMAAGLPDALQPLLTAFEAVLVRGAGEFEGQAERSGDGTNNTTAESLRWQLERAAWEQAAAAADARAGQELRALGKRVNALSEAVPVAADLVEAVVARGQKVAAAAEAAAMPAVAAAAALLESAAAGRVASARGALQGALLRLSAKAAAEDARLSAGQKGEEEETQDQEQERTPPRRLRAGGGATTTTTIRTDDGSDNNTTTATPSSNTTTTTSTNNSLASRLNFGLTRVADGAVGLSHAVLERGAEASLAAQARTLEVVERATARGGQAAAGLVAGWQASAAPRVGALLERARETADTVSLGLRDSLSPVVREVVRAGERAVRAGLAVVGVGVGEGR
jgi:hypothetical protein